MFLETILGGVTGLIGNVITGIMSYKTQKLKNEHDVAMIKAQTESMKIEAEMNIKVTQAQIEGEVELADAQAYVVSQKTGQQQFFSERWVDVLFNVEGWAKFICIPAGVLVAIMFGFVDWLRGFMRPALTIYLTGMSTFITYMAWEIMQKHGLSGMTVTEAIGLYNNVTSIIIYLTVSCVTWWFGDRRMAKFLTNMGKKKVVED